MNSNPHQTSILLWGTFLLYILLLVTGITHHELWSDELHSWNIAKSSAGYMELLANTRYEGHPPLWYSLLWLIAKCSHNVLYMQLAAGILACLAVFIVLFASPLPLIHKILIPFGYYFLFEYGVFSRNYMIGVVMALLICLIIRRTFPYKTLLYYFLLFLLSNSHLLGLLLAGSLHLYFLLDRNETPSKKGWIALHIVLGILVVLPAAYFIYPPADSQTNMHFWMEQGHSRQLNGAGLAVLRALAPMPAWWNPHFWNTEFLVEMQKNHPLLMPLNLFLTVLLIASCSYALQKNRKSQLLFSGYLLLAFGMHMLFFSISTERHAGFILISFLAAYWLSCYEEPPQKIPKTFVTVLLLVQCAAGFFCIEQDFRLPFSWSGATLSFTREVPPGEKLITDYWSMNTLSAMTDQSVYCIDLQTDLSFILFDRRLADVLQQRDRFSNGLNHLLEKEKRKTVYMISLHPPQEVFRADTLLPKAYRTELIDKREDAIEKGSNLYLYKITGLN